MSFQHRYKFVLKLFLPFFTARQHSIQGASSAGYPPSSGYCKLKHVRWAAINTMVVYW